MKTKNLIASALLTMSLLFSVNNTASAQRFSQEEMEARRAQMVEQQAERMAKDLDLKGDAKTSFVALYKEYQNELMSTQQRQRGQQRQDGQSDRKKLTDEEAQKQIDEYFARQESQVVQQQKRLEVEKKYYEEFKKTLSVQQLAKVFRQRQTMQRQGGQRPGGFGGPQGGFGGNGGGMRQGGFGGNGGGMGGDF